MDVLVIDDYLNDNDVNNIHDWLSSKHRYWSNFDCDSKTKRKAFNVTYKKNDVPIALKEFIDKRYNLFHFVVIETNSYGRIDKHIDSDFKDIMVESIPGSLITAPETVIYYLDVDDDMKGGELVVDNSIVKPKTNTVVFLPREKYHSVNEIEKSSKPRLCIVCERYFIRTKLLKEIESPVFRKG